MFEGLKASLGEVPELWGSPFSAAGEVQQELLLFLFGKGTGIARMSPSGEELCKLTQVSQLHQNLPKANLGTQCPGDEDAVAMGTSERRMLWVAELWVFWWGSPVGSSQ